MNCLEPRKRRFTLLLQVMLGVAALAVLQAPGAAGADQLKPDEVVIFYPAMAVPVRGGWEAELHGIVYEPERARALTATIRKALGIREDELTAEELALCRERIRYFLVDNERGKDLTVRIGETSTRLRSTAANGHFRERFRWSSVSTVFEAARLTNSMVRVDAAIPASGGKERMVPIELQVLDERGISVISDIDDTIKISEVRDRKALVRNTFCRPFQPVPGMAALYRSWADSAGARFHYLTASPWQLYLPLSEFVRSNGFPAGTFFMKDFRAKDSSFLQLFASPERYKPEIIEKLLKQFPRRRFVLVGDSGEKDPEIYAAVARKHPGQITKIFIRDVTGESDRSPRYSKTFAGLPQGSWKIFKDAAGIAGDLREATPAHPPAE